MKQEACGRCGWIPCKCPPIPPSIQHVPASFRSKLVNAIAGRGLECAKRPDKKAA